MNYETPPARIRKSRYTDGLSFSECVLQKTALREPSQDISNVAPVRKYLNSLKEFEGKNLTLYRFNDMPKIYLNSVAEKIIEFNGLYNMGEECTDGVTMFNMFPYHCIWKCTDEIYYADIRRDCGTEIEIMPIFIVIGDNLDKLEKFLETVLVEFALKGWEQKYIPEPDAMETVFLPGEQLSEIRKEITEFLESRELYQEGLGLPWKRGIVLHGPPGCGKTLLIRTIAKEFGLPLADFKNAIGHGGRVDISSIIHYSRNPLIDIYRPEKIKPVVVYIEDLDKIAPKFSRFEPESDVPETSVSNILNAIDGVKQVNEGCLFIATVNDAKELSSALMNRPGRFDSIYEIKLPDAETIMKFWKHHQFNIELNGAGKKALWFAEEFAKNEMSMAFAEEFVKACVMKFKRRSISSEQADMVWQRLIKHRKDYKNMFENRDGQAGFIGTTDKAASRHNYPGD